MKHIDPSARQSATPKSSSSVLCSFRYAANGIRLLFARERNARIHIITFVCVLAAGFFFRLDVSEWIAVILVSGVVLAAEATNTAIEALSDMCSHEYHPQIKLAKDVAAAAVLIVVLAATVVGIIIFLPRVIALIF